MRETVFTAQQLLEGCREAFRPDRMRRIGDIRVVQSAPSVVAITQSEPRLQIEVLHLIMEILSTRSHRNDAHWWLFSRLAEVLLVSRLPLSVADLVRILRVLALYAGTMGVWNCALSATKRYIDEFGCPFEIARVIVPQWDELRRKTRDYYAPIFDQIADAVTDTIPDGALVPGEHWVDVIDVGLTQRGQIW